MVKLRGFLTGIVFAAIGIGFAWAVPASMNAAGTGTDKSAENRAEAEARKEAHDAAKAAKPEKTPDDTDQDADEGAQGEHGAAVSTAAHCDVRGRAHGELVRSVAKDKDATVADAEAACAAALAAQPTDTHGKPDHAGTKGGRKPDDAGAPAGKGGKSADHKPSEATNADSGETEAEVEGEDDSSDDAAPGPPASPGSSSAGNSNAGGNSGNAGGHGKK